jgi:predicted Zn-dependent peptidase
VGKALQVVGDELERFRQDGITAEELERSKENVKGRMLLSLESTTARMNRLGSSVLAGMPLLSIDELEAEVDAVTLEAVAALGRELFASERLSAAGIGGDEAVFQRALEAVAA